MVARTKLSALLECSASSLYPANSLQAAERDARGRVETDYRKFFALLDRSYNLTIDFNRQFHDRSIRSLSSRERATLLLMGRIANGLRRVHEDAVHAYGPDACGHATSLFEFCWAAAYLSGNEDAAREWVTRERLSEGIDVRRCINSCIERWSAPKTQATTEYTVYQRLNAFKHASPAWLSFHRRQDWEQIGTLRVGPDLSPHGQWALGFALEMASQLVLLALRESAAQLLTGPARDQLIAAVDAANKERRRLHDILQRKWAPAAEEEG
jgi:hypothetical protein